MATSASVREKKRRIAWADFGVHYSPDLHAVVLTSTLENVTILYGSDVVCSLRT